LPERVMAEKTITEVAIIDGAFGERPERIMQCLLK
jgi:hypothetical protein